MITIGQLSKITGLRTSAIRYYEELKLIEPVNRTESGYRQYDDSAIATCKFIQRTQRIGFSLTDILLILNGLENSSQSTQDIYKVVHARYLELERQLTDSLILRHEMGLFLKDLESTAPDHNHLADPFMNQLYDRSRRNPSEHSPDSVLEWLTEYTSCTLSGVEAREIIQKLNCRHIHIWKEDDGYSILLITQDLQVEEALQALAHLEAQCQAHAHSSQAPELSHNHEGYLFIARGPNAFIFARLFLSLTE